MLPGRQKFFQLKRNICIYKLVDSIFILNVIVIIRSDFSAIILHKEKSKKNNYMFSQNQEGVQDLRHHCCCQCD